jgi:membrane protein YdbS with pleckstrin-like domain
MMNSRFNWAIWISIVVVLGFVLSLHANNICLYSSVGREDVVLSGALVLAVVVVIGLWRFRGNRLKQERKGVKSYER